MELLNQDEPELKQTLEKSKKLLQNSWSYLMEEKKESILSIEKELEYLQDEMQNKVTELNLIDKRLTGLVKEYLQWKLPFSRMKKKIQNWKKCLGKKKMVHPEGTLSTFKAELSENKKKIDSLRNHLLEVKSKFEEMNQA